MIWVNQTMIICHSETRPYSLIYRVLSFWINDIICHICKQFEYQHQIIWILRNFTLCLLAFNLIFLVYLMWRSTQCSTSSYGRVSYINDGDSARNAGPLSYKSETWKKIYRNRTSTERINNRVLNHYHLHQMRIRNKDKHAFFTIFACINIHLDAWIKDSV